MAWMAEKLIPGALKLLTVNYLRTMPPGDWPFAPLGWLREGLQSVDVNVRIERLQDTLARARRVGPASIHYNSPESMATFARLHREAEERIRERVRNTAQYPRGMNIWRTDNARP